MEGKQGMTKKLDELANLWEKTKDPIYKDLWYKFTVTEEGKEPEEKESMSFKKLLKSIVNTNPKWTGSLNYNNKKGREVTHNILKGKKI